MSITTKNPKPILRGPAALILHEKHGDLFFHVPDEEALFKVALDIVEKRLLGGWSLAPVEPRLPSLTRGQTEVLPQGPVKDAAFAELASYEYQVKKYHFLRARWDSIQVALKEKSGRLAWEILSSRSTHGVTNADNPLEYERVSLEYYESSYLVPSVRSQSEADPHPSHCCREHGCKYNENSICPVVTGKVLQEGPCEWCGLEYGEGS